MPKLDQLYFSQYALGTFELCPRKFRYRYLDGLFWPRNWTSAEQRDAMEKGRLFHLLAQRYFSGIDTSIPAGAPFEDDLTKWLARLAKLIELSPLNLYLPELHLRLDDHDTCLQAKYDLIILAGDQVYIYDWKTDERPLQPGRLATAMQTVVYRYLALEAAPVYTSGTPVLPAKVTMTYWNPSFPTDIIKYAYSAKEHQAAGQMLIDRVKTILALSYPGFTRTADLKACRRCEYSPICRGQAAGHELTEEDFDPGEDLTWEDAPEIAY